MPLLYAAAPQNMAAFAIRLFSASWITGRWQAPQASRAMR